MMQQEIVGTESTLVASASSGTSDTPNISNSAATSNVPPPVSSTPSQFATANLLGHPPAGATGLLSNPPQPLSSIMQAKAGSYTSPVLLSGISSSPLSTSVGLAPLSTLTTSAGMSSVAPPPKTGFQPVAHSLQEYESHTLTGTAQPQQTAGPPISSATGAVGVNIFTPTYDPNAPPSPYVSPPPAVMTPTAYTSPAPIGNIHSNSSSSIVQLDMPTGGQVQNNQANYQIQSPQDLSSLLEWLKTNETVNKMMHKAKVGVETVITAMDPQMKDVLYSGGDINIVVASAKPVKIEPVKEAFQRIFGRATVSGQDSQPGIAPQPVGFSSGIKGSEERINNLRRNGLVNNSQVIVAIESFIVDLQSEQWYDIACLMLSDPVNHITLHTFTQAMPVQAEYVQQAQSQTPADYNLAWSGLAVTAGSMMDKHNLDLKRGDWHYYYGGVSRSDIFLLAAKQLAYMYKQRLSKS